MKKFLAALAMIGLIGSAHAATLNVGTVTLTLNSTSITCPISGTFPAPLAANTVICTVAVLPAGWAGVVSGPTGGADSSKFVVTTGSGGLTVIENNVVLTAGGSAAGTSVYTIGTITSTP